MVPKFIEFALRNRLIVLLTAAGLFAWGVYSIQKNPIDAIPDLSENQVIVFTEWMGRSPQVVEDQITYPLVSNLQGIPKIRNIRGTSMFGMSFVYIVFEDNVDVYWARTRVLERLNYAQRLLPQGVTPSLGPDGTGVGHVFWYHLDAPKMDLGEQRVWVQTATNTYAIRMVKTGMESGNQIEITSGPKEGDIVVLTGAYLLNSEYIFNKGTDPMAGMAM